MSSSKCTHIRIRDSNDYNINVENVIQSIEKQYKIDFRTFPGWKDIIQRLHVTATDRKRKIQGANLRKSMIIEKLYIQTTRPSPFELTDGLCRTANKWNNRIIHHEKSEPKVLPDSFVKMKKNSEIKIIESPHPNTEMASTEDLSQLSYTHLSEPEAPKVPPSPELQLEQSHLPVKICTNNHKYISPLESKFSMLSGKSPSSHFETTVMSGEDNEEWLIYKPTTSVVGTPTPITIINKSLEEQTVQFTVTNCWKDQMHIRFKRFLDCTPFLRAKITPDIPKILYPGVPVKYNLIFKLKNEEDFVSSIYFRVGRGVYDNAPTESFCIPITSAFTILRSVSVSDTVTIPSVYPWHLKRNSKYSTSTIKISVNDSYSYHVHIYRRYVVYSVESDVLLSLAASGPNTQSVFDRNDDNDTDLKTLASVKSANRQNELKPINNVDLMSLIVNEIVEHALEAFLLESTYLFLGPHSKAVIPVYFTKIDNIGCHQRYYDFELIDSKTDKVVMTKTTKVFAEVLAHPIQISPIILDMSKSPVSHGYCEDRFFISNSNKIYPVSCKIKLTTKMKKMFYVEPMETVLPTQQTVSFAVKFCSRDFLAVNPSEDLVHFTFKIIVNGYKNVYENVPPIFYEVIAPCAVEFKKVYNEKFFREE